jgi:hypothetical protein
MKSNFHFLILLIVLSIALVSLIYQSPYQYEFSTYQSLKRAGLEDWVIGSVPTTAKNIKLQIQIHNKNPDGEPIRQAQAEFEYDEATLQKIRTQNCTEPLEASQNLFKTWSNLFGLITKGTRFENLSCGRGRQITIDHKNQKGFFFYKN